MGVYFLVLRKMKHKVSTKKSTYHLVQNDHENPPHPSYDVMIKEVLSEATNGLAKKTLLSRLKARWGVKDRFAKPAIESSLKRLRKGKKVKRCVNGFYKVSKKKPESSIDSSSIYGSSLTSTSSLGSRASRWPSLSSICRRS